LSRQLSSLPRQTQCFRAADDRESSFSSRTSPRSKSELTFTDTPQLNSSSHADAHSSLTSQTQRPRKSCAESAAHASIGWSAFRLPTSRPTSLRGSTQSAVWAEGLSAFRIEHGKRYYTRNKEYRAKHIK
jgi:hypothetical protein